MSAAAAWRKCVVMVISSCPEFRRTPFNVWTAAAFLRRPLRTLARKLIGDLVGGLLAFQQVPAGSPRFHVSPRHHSRQMTDFARASMCIQFVSGLGSTR
jgi:hypothetical protein